MQNYSKDDYVGYIEALDTSDLQNLSTRRQLFTKRLAQKCVSNDSDIFPLNSNSAELRNGEKFRVKFAKSVRLPKSAIPSIQKILNRHK